MTPALLYVHDLSATGVVRNALALARRLTGDRRTLLVCGRADGALAGQAAGLELRGLGGHGREAALRLRALVREHAPAVAVSAGNRGHPLFFAALAGLPGVRRIYRFSNDIDHRGADGARAWWKPLADGAQLALLRRSADHVVTVSAGLARDPRLAGVAVTAVPNGVDVAAVRAAAVAPPDHPWFADGGPPVVMGIGRLTRQKNFATLIRAAAQANTGRPLRLLILGDGPLRAELLDLANALNLKHIVDMPGVLPNPHPLLARAACFALPSLWEGASNALLEALALDVPLVASRAAGNAADVLGDGAHGLLVPPGDAAALAAALLRQTGPDALRPGARARAFDRAAGLDAWARLVAAEAARLAPSPAAA